MKFHGLVAVWGTIRDSFRDILIGVELSFKRVALVEKICLERMKRFTILKCVRKTYYLILFLLSFFAVKKNKIKPSHFYLKYKVMNF